MLGYGRQWIEQEDIDAVAEVLRSDWLTCGPMVERFERTVAEFVGASHGVAVSSGTAALHAAVHAAGIGAGDEVIVPAMTFAASANAVLYAGGKPVFADVDADTLLLDPADVRKKISERTRAILPVDYAGQPCDYEQLRKIAREHKLTLIADACHALGATVNERRVGTLAELTVFSFHPVKHITTCEGGMIVCQDERLAREMRTFRNHGIDTDARERAAKGSWYYEMVTLGFNYRLSDVQCALGVAQMRRLPQWLERRREIARRYDEAFATIGGVRPLGKREGVSHAYHLYVVRFDLPKAKKEDIFAALRAEGIGVNVHYIPVHLHPYYRKNLGTKPGMCPVAERAYEQIVSLPMFPAMSDQDVSDVIEAVGKVVRRYGG
ncbi:MAG: UDP-4-amino-4,6-dideoxy-N-acetyl-beta-L-altrosamine transaminase [Acidobacteriia bacterium]|nr:UDP-4-amino-4,6-dideoxy-N-acetyl-beta-L-altrosamine transaminase [Terriglobia bacterium]